MNKTTINTLIKNMTEAGIVTKSTPWLVEGQALRDGHGFLREGKKADIQLHVRYVGIKPNDVWLEVLSEKDNVLLKFVLETKSARLEIYLANKPPFTRFWSKMLLESDKWEPLLGEVKHRLKQDKLDMTHHREKAGNLYALLKPQLK